MVMNDAEWTLTDKTWKVPKYMGKRRITTVLAAVCLAAGVSVAGAATATAGTAPKARAAAHDKPARLDPFTGKMTTRYLIKRDGAESTDYFYWTYAADSNECVSDPGVNGGTVTGDQCQVAYGNQLWAPVSMPSSGTWRGDSEIESSVQINSGVNRCIDDPGGADNIKIVMENCAVVGGQAWANNDPEWLNAIALNNAKPPYQAVTLDYGTVKNGTWIVTNPYLASAQDEKWVGP
jgi:hypothetical protein